MLFERFRQIGRAVEHVQRYRTIIGVFLKYGYEDLVRRLPLPSVLRWSFQRIRFQQQEIALLTPHERLRRAFEELGPTFIKLGTSRLPDIFDHGTNNGVSPNAIGAFQFRRLYFSSPALRTGAVRAGFRVAHKVKSGGDG